MKSWQDCAARLIGVAAGREPADWVVRGGIWVNVHSRELIPGAGRWPPFVRNRSEQFEGRLVLVEIPRSPSILFDGMEGARLPVVVAHGEGRAQLEPAQQGALEREQLVALRFCDASGAAALRYPANPNGSPGGITGLTTPDGRVTILMPHPERVFRSIQLSWRPSE